jgi:hypothetical protein
MRYYIGLLKLLPSTLVLITWLPKVIIPEDGSCKFCQSVGKPLIVLPSTLALGLLKLLQSTLFIITWLTQVIIPEDDSYKAFQSVGKLSLVAKNLRSRKYLIQGPIFAPGTLMNMKQGLYPNIPVFNSLLGLHTCYGYVQGTSCFPFLSCLKHQRPHAYMWVFFFCLGTGLR